MWRFIPSNSWFMSVRNLLLRILLVNLGEVPYDKGNILGVSDLSSFRIWIEGYGKYPFLFVKRRGRIWSKTGAT